MENQEQEVNEPQIIYKSTSIGTIVYGILIAFAIIFFFLYVYVQHQKQEAIDNIQQRLEHLNSNPMLSNPTDSTNQ